MKPQPALVPDRLRPVKLPVPRKYEFLIVLFGGEQRQVTVLGEHRREAFTAAIRSCSDGNNIFSVWLVSDNGEKVDPDVKYGGVPFAESDDFTDPYWDVQNLRAYAMSVQLFRDCWTDEVRAAPARAEALVAVLGGVNPDDVHRIDLRGTGKFRNDSGGSGGYWHLDPMLPYGGVREWERHD